MAGPSADAWAPPSLSSLSTSGAGSVAVVCASRLARWYAENAKAPPVEALLLKTLVSKM
jgi:hypothetical protein